MEIIIDKNTRVVKSLWYLSAIFTSVYKLQRKGKYFWRTVAWIYADVIGCCTDQFKIDWLLWDEKERKTK